ncbi:flagellar motor protein MotB [Paremcibacter congregatus]|uniref:Motility protein MotB n=1 Tax=Paremcibacter congregatus TaxID=2043170 RepID=A0A2G4YN65_9PROT|nr:flagellar motor protein MotB [Paremcibacter congregatus]PHZ83723.1 motility protein MotB [Paremcibacter congregatus]QDE27424.1 flagellar motor protein MotB [Paremcibacter congregatus]
MADEARPIIIKRVKKVSGGSHGGAWKVAYADFVTAMMAFFLMLWLLNATSKDQKKGLADYFTPTTASTESSSGSGDILGGVSLNTDGAQDSAVTVSIPNTAAEATPPKDAEEEAKSKEEEFEEMVAKKEQTYFEEMTDDLKTAIQQNPELAQLKNQVLIDITEDGMRIQLVDKDNRPMFRPAKADLYNYAEKMLKQIAKVVIKMPNRISISGHTDATPFSGRSNYSNWELSADRANASRRVLSESGVHSGRLAEVMGKASTEPLLPDQPKRSENRRITILLLRESPTLPAGFM